VVAVSFTGEGVSDERGTLFRLAICCNVVSGFRVVGSVSLIHGWPYANLEKNLTAI